jgi:phage terminase large subunit-like protein
MSEDIVEGPDANDVRRHAKRMYTEAQYRQRYRRIDRYVPNAKQYEFHNLIAREKCLRAGNQVGKTHGAGAEMVFHALGLYADWPDRPYLGRKFLTPPPIERPYDFIGWAGCTTQVKTRDGAQLKLLGPIGDEGMLGTGLIPLDNLLGRPTLARGTSEYVDTIKLRREGGGNAIIRLKTFEAGREAWQGDSVDVAWIDEDPGKTGIYGETLARLTATNGIIIASLTPLLGVSPLRKRFREGTPGTAEVIMGIRDCLKSAGGHIPDERLPELMAQYPEHERETRLNGADMQGEGAVFDTPVSQIRERIDPARDVPEWWPWLWGVDFRHSGSASTGHPFAAVLACWDRDADVIHIVHAIKMMGLAPMHVATMKQHPMHEAPVSWPHDGGRGASVVDGGTIAQVYRKLGLNMRPTHATFASGGFNFENGISEMLQRFASGRLMIADHLTPVFDEYLGLHRENGLVNKVDDDLLSAIRQVCMDIRFAKTGQGPGGRIFRRPPGPQPRPDFDIFTGRASHNSGGGDFDIFGT